MNKINLFLFLMLLTGCASMDVSAESQTVLQPTMTALAIKSPTPAIDYQSTADVAQTAEAAALSTADAANAEVEAAHIARAQITAGAEENALQVLQITHEANVVYVSGTQMVIAGTATAAPTSIPLTETQQVFNNTAIADYSTLTASMITSTFEAPDVLRRMKDAEAYNAVADFWVRIWALGMVGVFLLAVPIALFVLPKKKKPTTEEKKFVITPPENQKEIVPSDLGAMVDVMVRKNSDTAYPSAERMVIPCTPDQFTALAESILNGVKTFSFGQWSGKDSPFTAQKYGDVRRALLRHRLVKSIPPDGRLMLTDDGDEMFRGWMERQELLGGFEFGEPSSPLPQLKNDHKNDDHDA